MATDMTHHTLVPKHTKISESEKEKLFEKYTTSARELPKILKNDPAIAKLSIKEGVIFCTSTPNIFIAELTTGLLGIDLSKNSENAIFFSNIILKVFMSIFFNCLLKR